MDYYDALIHDLTQSIIIVSHRDVYKFITLKREYTGQNIVQNSEDREYVNAYNLFTRQIECIATIEITEHIHKNFEDCQDNDKKALEILDYIKKQIEKYRSINPNSEFTDLDLYALISKQHTLNYKDIHEPNYILEFLFNCNFILSAEDIFSDNIVEYKRERVILACKKIIQTRIDEVVSELNQLKDQSDDEEDISDIDTIIEMYTHILDEIDFSQCISLVDFFNKWPPLLLPLPKYVDMVVSNLKSIDSPTNDYINFMNVVDNTLTYAEMRELLNDLELLQPNESQYVGNEYDITHFKDYLRYKLSNEHK